MPSLRSVQGLSVFDRKGGALGRVTHVLFHPADPYVVGVELQPPNVAYVVSRGARYIALEGLELGEDRLDITEDAKEWTGTKAEKALGFEWESTVIWTGMELVTESGTRVGYIADASFQFPGGRLLEVLISEGITSDVAVGTRQIDSSMLLGFDGKVVRAKDEAAEAQFSGGLAARAGTNVAVAKVVASEAGKTAAALGGKAVSAAAKSKTAKSAWGMFKETGKAFREGLKGDDE